METKDIRDAWARIRTIDQTIPDEILDFMKDAAIEKLEDIKEYPDLIWSDRKKATFAFFDKLPEGLREMAKENYQEGYSYEVPNKLADAIYEGMNWFMSEQGFAFWSYLVSALRDNKPSITLNGITYDLTKCYE